MKNKKLAFFDLETNDLLGKATTVWTAVAYLEDEQEYLIYHSPYKERLVAPSNTTFCVGMEGWLEHLNHHTLVAHSGISFDLQVLKKLFNYNYNLENVVDTLILSRLYYPDREGHSLDYWGMKLNLPKGDFHDFSMFSQEMLTYCIRDVDLLRKLYFTLQAQEEAWDWSEAIKLSNYFTDVIARQEQHGVLFDKASAEILLKELEVDIAAIEEKVLAEIPRKAVQQGATVNKPFLKSGGYTKQVQEWIETL
jgi:DNA polymerase I-like protein with 3'-5' exonuclease and polymerase domains